MQKCLLVVNKKTRLKEYIERRALFEVVEERNNLASIDIDKMDIIDVDKLIFIYYETEQDVKFRADLNALRRLLQCSFFHIDSAIFILVDVDNIMYEELIYTAIKSSELSSDKVEVIHHKGSLMLDDAAKYLSDASFGTDTHSSYRTVYITEADIDEKDRFVNSEGNIKAMLPVLTDAVNLYKQRISTEAQATDRIIVQKYNLEKTVENFTDVKYKNKNYLNGFLFSGKRYSKYELCAKYLLRYFTKMGLRTFIISIQDEELLKNLNDNCDKLSIKDINSTVVPRELVCSINISVDQLGLLFSFITNVKGIDSYIFLVDESRKHLVKTLVNQFCDIVYSTFVLHMSENDIKDYVCGNDKDNTVLITDAIISEDFDLLSYKDKFIGTSVAMMPDDNIDYNSFFDLITCKL